MPGSLAGWLPLVEVRGFGPIPLPFPEVLLDALIAHATGGDRGWRIDGSDLVLAERIWDPLLEHPADLIGRNQIR